MIEKRRYIRLDSTMNVRYKVLDNAIALSQSKNISAGGLRMYLKEELAPGSKIDLEIAIPGSKNPVMVTGEVVWQYKKQPNQIDTGIKYLDIHPGDMQRITDYVLSRLREQLTTTKDKITKTRKLFLFFTKEIRMPGDKSKDIATPDFLIHEVNLPGDKVRYARIKSTVGLKYKVSNATTTATCALSQYVSGKGVWFLADENIDLDTALEIEIELSKNTKSIIATGKVVSCQQETRYDDTTVKTCYEIGVKFTDISAQERKRIIRYVYACQSDYMMVGKTLPPGRLRTN
ncbi:MAG: PilZ domain-containing protein [Candidatus Omnitrophica bacterium]|nr:PilZ domain-containing protein [Candidatus Omnitrophota bacterium]